jgi:hypothetical protein
VTVPGPTPAGRAELVIDLANLIGSRPNGWWRDRAGAATALLQQLVPLAGTVVAGPDGVDLELVSVIAVVEGKARAAADPEPAGRVSVLRAGTDGDTAVVDTAAELNRAGRRVLVVTADRGLRARLPDGIAVTGPRWLLALLDR